MSLFQINGKLIFTLILLFCGCSKPNSDFYDKSTKQWNNYLSEIGAEDIKLYNSILLILKSNECAPSLSELNWWDNYQFRNRKISVQIIILEKYASTFQTFLAFEDLNLPAFRDSAGIIYDHNLIPSTPQKLYFDELGQIKKIAPIGFSFDPGRSDFLASIED